MNGLSKNLMKLTGTNVRDLVHKMKNLPKMDQTSASKVADFATEALSLMSQLEEILEVDHRNEQPTFLFFSEIIVPKFNTLASQMWEKLYTREEGESFALGHSLGLKDLKKVINKTKSKLRHREYNRVFDNRTGKDANKKEAEDKKKKLAMPESYSFGTSTNPKEKTKKSNKDPVEGEVKCPVPGCTQKLEKGPKDTTHRYIVQCPNLKKQNPEALLKWFRNNGYKCYHCFAKTHNSSECQFRDFTCKRLIADKNGKPRYCHGQHHYAMHDPKVDGKIIPPNQYPSNKGQNQD